MNPYRVIGVPDGSPFPVVRKAYKRKCLELHPDKNPGLGEEPFKRLQQAYATLCDSSSAEGSSDTPASSSATWEGSAAGTGTARTRGFCRRGVSPPPVSVEEIIRGDRAVRKASMGKSLQELLREQEAMKRELELQRHASSPQAGPQSAAVAGLQSRLRALNVPGLEWKVTYEQFTPGEEAERRRIVAQLIADSESDSLDDLMLYRLYVSASEVIIGRRPSYG
eukprot:RCo019748